MALYTVSVLTADRAEFILELTEEIEELTEEIEELTDDELEEDEEEDDDELDLIFSTPLLLFEVEDVDD